MYRFGVETMEEHRIRVLTTSDLDRVAETARRELRSEKVNRTAGSFARESSTKAILIIRL